MPNPSTTGAVATKASTSNTASWYRTVAILVSGIGISSIGDFIYLVALNLFVLQTTHSPAAVAGIWVVGKVAALLVGPWAGSLTDRWPLRAQLAGIDLCRAILVSLLPLAGSLAGIIVILFGLGICTTFFSNAFLPYQTAIVPQAQRKRVNAIVTMLRSGSLLVGPAIAGTLMAHGATKTALWLDGASFLLSAGTILLLPATHLVARKAEPITKPQQDASAPRLLPAPAADPSHAHIRTWQALRTDWDASLRILQDRPLFTALYVLTAVASVLAMTADAQEVVFAENALHLGQFGYGMMVMAAGVGFVGGALLLSIVAKRIKTAWLIGVGGLLSSAGYLAYALSHSFWWAVIGLVVLGLFNSALNVGVTSYRQHAIPVGQMGRLNNVLDPPRQVLNIVFILLGGWLSTVFGVRVVMVGMTVPMCIAGVGMLALVTRPKHQVELTAADR